MATTVNTPNIPLSRNPLHLCEELQKKWPEVRSKFYLKTGNDLILTCTWRSITEQTRLYEIGRTKPGKIVTWVDGIKKKSKHNLFPARAFDVAVLKGGKVSWSKADYLPLGPITKLLGLSWGGYWEGKEDYPHVEIA